MVDNFSKSILDALKTQYEVVNGPTRYDTSMKSAQAIYYFPTIEKNLVEPMDDRHKNEYSSGSGNELHTKMRAIRSSSAMTFNLLGNDEVKIKKNGMFLNGSYRIEYEKKMPTLRVSRQPANLDAYLCSEDGKEGIFCEMKMTEWIFNRPGMLKEAYLNKENYLDNGGYDVFSNVFKNLIKSTAINGTDYNSIFTRYDAFQMMKHTLSIYNSFKEGQFKEVKKATLINCVWEMQNPQILGTKYENKYRLCLEKEHLEYEIFRKKYQPIIELFKGIGISFEMKYLTFFQFLNILDKKQEQRNLLERYVI